MADRVINYVHKKTAIEFKHLADRDSNKTTLIDIRPNSQYVERHLSGSLNYPSTLWKSATVEDIMHDLIGFHFPQLLAHSIHYSTYQRVEKKFKEKLHHALGHYEHTIIIVNDHRTQQEKENTDMFFRHLSQIFNVEGTLIDAFLTHSSIKKKELHVSLRFFTANDGFEASKFDRLVYQNSKMEEKNLEFMEGMLSIVPQSIFIGTMDAYLQHIFEQMSKTEQELYNDKKTRANNRVFPSVCHLSETHPVLPETILQQGSCRHSFGVIPSYKRKPIEEVSEPVATTQAESEAMADNNFSQNIDHNVVIKEFTFENSFSFTVNSVEFSFQNDKELKKLLRSSSVCINGATFKQEQTVITINPNSYGLLGLLSYFLEVRRWSLQRGLLYLVQTNGAKILKFCSSPIFVIGLRLLLQVERELLPYKWPSIELISFVLVNLKQEENALFHLQGSHPRSTADISFLEEQVFTLIDKGNATSLIQLIQQNQYLITARRNITGKDGQKLIGDDETPLLYCLDGNVNNSVRNNKECFDLLSGENAINLTSIEGHDALYCAIGVGESFIVHLVEKGASIRRCSLGVKTNPLQKALKFKITNTKVLELLMDEITVNYKDRFSVPAIHYAIDMVNHNTSDKELESIKRIIKKFVKNRANIYVTNPEGLTILEFAKTVKQAPKSFCNFLENLMKEEGNIRHAPFNSFAPERGNINIEYYIDGEKTFKAMAKALLAATPETNVYITDWWLTPELYMDRSSPNVEDWEEFRFDNIVKKIAKNGTKIYIIVWENFESFGENIQSSRTQSYLSGLHPNIYVMRHSSSILRGSMTHHQKTLIVDNIAFVGGLDICSHRYDTQLHNIDPVQIHFPGKDYFNPRHLGNLSHPDSSHQLPLKDYIGLQGRIVPRMGWHDITISVDGDAALDVEINFIQRWNFLQNSISKSMPILTRPQHKFSQATPTSIPAVVQVTRSIAKWSIGFENTERSIYNAIIHAITNAKSYVYIETQFFISIQDETLTESLHDCIYNRIRIAISNNTPFKIILLLPMFPEGDPTDAFSIQRIIYFQISTINLIKKLVGNLTRCRLKSVSDYFQIYSLAANCLVEEGRVIASEQIYIHAKLLITDDMVICGSANLNMRSLLGDRDSEIAVVAKSEELASKMRNELWREHMGLLEAAPDHPILQKLTGNFHDDFPIFHTVATSNTKVYKKLFGKSHPLGGAKRAEKFKQEEEECLKNFRSTNPETVKETYIELKKHLNGHLVKYPHKFLIKDVKSTENLKFGVSPLGAVTTVLNPKLPLIFVRNAFDFFVANTLDFLHH